MPTAVKDPGTLVYKCRLCSVTFEGSQVDSLYRAFFFRMAHRIDYTTEHKCMDGRVGIADLAGGKPDPQEEIKTDE